MFKDHSCIPPIAVRAINWTTLSTQLAKHTRPKSRPRRFLSAPLRSLAVPVMRRLGWVRAISTKLAWGDSFDGYLPEAVTSAIWRTGHYEPLTTQFVIETLRPGDVFVDIGAHFGYFSLLASRLVGPEGSVVAIEAMPSTFATLVDNISKNNTENVELHNCAAYSMATSLDFKDYGVIHSSLNTAFTVRGVLEDQNAEFSNCKVSARTADEILEKYRDSRIAIIKIDAESSEEFVLQGLKETMAVSKPIIVLELGGSANDDPCRVRSITDLLLANGYLGKRWQDKRLHALLNASNPPHDNYVYIHPRNIPNHLKDAFI